MNQINAIMDVMSDKFREYKKIIYIGVIIVVALCVGAIAFVKIKEINNNKYPIKSISAESKSKFTPDSKIEAGSIKVTATHENGGKTKLSNDEFILSASKTNKVGAYTTVTVTLKSDKKIKCSLKLPSNRRKILGFSCGYPKVKNVTAVLYDTGELSFEGKGDVLIENEGNFLWNDYDEDNDYPIKYVSFQKTVEPTNMDYWFADCETLEYVEPIPASVVTMVGTFKNCEALRISPDLSKATKLLNMSETFKGCISLTQPPSIPSSVVNMTETFLDCKEIITGANVSEAVNVTTMESCYSGCSKLSDVEIAPNSKIVSSMFEDCINLKKIDVIPASVLDMSRTFEGCSSLTTVGAIPYSVELMDNTFYECPLLSYQIVINANPIEFDGIFDGAAVATKLNLAGDSKLLDAMANTNDTGNITVFGHKPNPSIQSRDDVFEK